MQILILVKKDFSLLCPDLTNWNKIPAQELYGSAGASFWRRKQAT